MKRLIPKSVDELLELQDKAIQALQQATLALQIALQALQDSRNEKGEQQKMVFVPVTGGNTPPNGFPNIPSLQPLSFPYVGDTPGLGQTWSVKYGEAKGGLYFSAQDAVQNAINTVQTVSNSCYSSQQEQNR